MTNKSLKAGVIGWPIQHSLSPIIHKHWLAEHSIQGEYIPIAIEPENLKGFLYELSDNGWKGLNVTLPHKIAAMKAVDKLDHFKRRSNANKDLKALGIASIFSGYLAFYFIKMLIISYKFQERSEGADEILIWIPQTSLAIGSTIFFISVFHQFILKIKES
mgnify:CR=1 FL=1